MIRTKIFDYTEESYAALVAINDPIWPERPLRIADFEHEDDGRSPEPDAEKYAARWLADVDGQIVGHGQLIKQWQRTDANAYDALIEVLPAFRERGVGRALLAEMTAAVAAKEPVVFECITMEDRAKTIAWLGRHHFKQTQREPMSALDVTQVDVGKLAVSAEIAQASNIRIVSLSQLAKSDPNYKPKLFDLMWEIIIDVPGSNAENREKPGYDYFEKVTMGDPTFTPDGWFVAVENDGDAYVGMCNVHPKLLDGHWNNGLTGVLRSHRRRGLATALKMRSIAHVREQGGVEISTSNDENNPMYDLNMALGFAPRPAILTFTRP